MEAWIDGMILLLIVAAAVFYLIKKFLIVTAVLTRPTIRQRDRYRRAVGTSLRRQAARAHHEPKEIDPLYYYSPDENDDEEDEF